MLRKAFFFDRDGVVNVSPGAGYVLNKEGFHFSEGVKELLAWLKCQGFALVLVTSQQGVGKGLMTMQDLDEIHAMMQEELAQVGGSFDAIYSCTCLSSDPQCTCRKPSAEMVLKAADSHGLDLSQSWLIGDHDRDIKMATNAGVPNTIRIFGDHPPGVEATATFKSVAEVLPWLQQQLAAS